MTAAMWADFNSELLVRERLVVGGDDMVVEVNEIQMTKHLCIDRMSEAIVLTISQ